jgi:hypothetical protein
MLGSSFVFQVVLLTALAPRPMMVPGPGFELGAGQGSASVRVEEHWARPIRIRGPRAATDQSSDRRSLVAMGPALPDRTDSPRAILPVGGTAPV